MDILFKNVLVIDPQSPHHQTQKDVAIRKGEIVAVAEANTLKPDQYNTIKEGACLSPGWVDMRCYLSDPGFEWKDDFFSLSHAALNGGFTRVVCHPQTSPPIDNASTLNAVQAKAGTLPIFFHFCGHATLEGKGKVLSELFDLYQNEAVAFSDGWPGIQDPAIILRTLQYLKSFEGILMQPLAEAALTGKNFLNESEVSVRMGIKGIPNTAEGIALQRNLEVLRYIGGKLHLGPITTQAALEALRKAKLIFPGLSVETSAHYLYLSEEAHLNFDSSTKIYPPLQNSSAVEALQAAVAEGLIDVVTSGHHPHDPEQKLLDFMQADFGINGLETAFLIINTAMSEAGYVIDDWIHQLTSKPREILGLPKATIQKGATAELSYFNLNETTEISARHFSSKSKSTPFLNQRLNGKVLGVYAKKTFIQSNLY